MYLLSTSIWEVPAMDIIFQQLFDAFCFPYDPERIPEGRDPVRAYGRFAFEVGFRLAVRLTAACLADPDK